VKERIFGTHDTDLEWKTEVGIDEVLCVCGEPGGEWTQWGWRNDSTGEVMRVSEGQQWQAISATVKSATNQLGDTSRSTRRQFMSFECLFRINRTNKLSKKAVLSLGNHAMLQLISNMGMSKNQTRRTFQHLVLLFVQFRTARSKAYTPLILFNFYRAMHFSSKRGIAIACRLSVGPSLCLWRWWIVIT